jgi:hypothetical protein
VTEPRVLECLVHALGSDSEHVVPASTRDVSEPGAPSATGMVGAR